MFVAEDAKGPEFLRILSLMDEARSRAARLHKKQQELLQKEACCPLQTDGLQLLLRAWWMCSLVGRKITRASSMRRGRASAVSTSSSRPNQTHCPAYKVSECTRCVGKAGAKSRMGELLKEVNAAKVQKAYEV